MRTKLTLAGAMQEPGFFFEAGDGFQKKWPSPLFLSDAEYGRAMEAFPRVCSDIIAVDPHTNSFLLAKRRHQAAKGIWMFGGGQRTGETPRESAVRILKNETGVILPPDDLQFLSLTVYFRAYRNPAPQTRGEHAVVFTFVFAPTLTELETMSLSLDDEEYDTEHGIRPYSIKDIEALNEPNGPSLLKHWHAVFG